MSAHIILAEERIETRMRATAHHHPDGSTTYSYEEYKKPERGTWIVLMLNDSEPRYAFGRWFSAQAANRWVRRKAREYGDGKHITLVVLPMTGH